MDTRFEAFELAPKWLTDEEHSWLRFLLHPKYRPWFAKRAGNRVENVCFITKHTPLRLRYRRCVLVPVEPQKPLVHTPRFVTLRTDMSRVADYRPSIA